MINISHGTLYRLTEIRIFTRRILIYFTETEHLSKNLTAPIRYVLLPDPVGQRDYTPPKQVSLSMVDIFTRKFLILGRFLMQVVTMYSTVANGMFLAGMYVKVFRRFITDKTVSVRGVLPITIQHLRTR